MGCLFIYSLRSLTYRLQIFVSFLFVPRDAKRCRRAKQSRIRWKKRKKWANNSISLDELWRKWKSRFGHILMSDLASCRCINSRIYVILMYTFSSDTVHCVCVCVWAHIVKYLMGMLSAWERLFVPLNMYHAHRHLHLDFSFLSFIIIVIILDSDSNSVEHVLYIVHLPKARKTEN